MDVIDFAKAPVGKKKVKVGNKLYLCSEEAINWAISWSLAEEQGFILLSFRANYLDVEGEQPFFGFLDKHKFGEAHNWEIGNKEDLVEELRSDLCANAKGSPSCLPISINRIGHNRVFIV